MNKEKEKQKDKVVVQNNGNQNYYYYLPFFYIEKVSRRIGRLTLEERLVKVQRYLAKKRDRKWKPKISYDCRKAAAEVRLRSNGKFVKRSNCPDNLSIRQS